VIYANDSTKGFDVTDTQGPLPLSAQDYIYKFNNEKYDVDTYFWSDTVVTPQLSSNQEQIFDYNRDKYPDAAVADYVLTNTGTPSAFDPYNWVQGDSQFESVDLLLHFDSTIDDDKSSTNHTVVAYNGASIDTTVKKWGSGSLSVDGVNDYVAIADSPDWDFGTGNFTIEFWFRLKDQDGYNWLLNRNSSISSNYHYRKWVIIAAGDKIQFYGAGDYIMSGGPSITAGGSTTSIGTWHHCALVRNSNTTSLYLDGVSQGSVSDYQNHSYTDGIQIGAGQDQWANAYIDDLRITRAVRYTGNFSVPTEAFPDVALPVVARPYAEGMVQTLNASTEAGNGISGAEFSPFNGYIREFYHDGEIKFVGASSSSVGGKLTQTNLPANSHYGWVKPIVTGTSPTSAAPAGKIEVKIYFDVQYNKYASLQISDDVIIKTKDMPTTLSISADKTKVEGIIRSKVQQTFTAETATAIYTIVLEPFFYVIRNPSS
jgi:hypothetical protein